MAAVAKTLVLTAPAAYVRVVLPASERRGLDKARAYVGGGKRVHLAREEKLARDYPAFELGAVPPLGISAASVCSAASQAADQTTPVDGPPA